MVGMDSYMNAYLDRRMKDLIQDWDLATQNDLGDFEDRLQAIEETTKQIEIIPDQCGYQAGQS